MAYTYAQKKHTREITEPAAERTVAPGSDMSALTAGAARPTDAQKGRPVDLDGAIRAKMENAFGDLSAVKLYESAAVGEAGAEAVAQGNEIAFAPGMADFSSRAGQERLGHELSHVMSQRSGAVRGEGFLNDPVLEARADREGAMAAAGAQVYSGPVTAALSGAAPSSSSAAPMQAKRGKANTAALKKNRKLNEESEVSEQTKDSDPRSAAVEKKHRKQLIDDEIKRWNRMKKTKSNGDFYDEIGNTIAMSDSHGIGEVPDKYLNWYWKHHKLSSRWSGKKGWGTQEEHNQLLEERKRREKRPRFLVGDESDYEDTFI